ncbi:variable surface protein [Plasmodium gonderi]|uniref:Variable surface protein n=1 Tax=Plasmodium gonderi TaxID=77519 RepID=A0A1Y1JK48_PLAGO|nr:variable surface protein [Plasmodium gonderi]GAW82038.1 variable surface protein [Plasmodium gonderi]
MTDQSGKEWHDELDWLPSFDIYNKLESVNVSGIKSDCDDLKSVNKDVVQICKMVAENLRDLDNLRSNVPTDPCYYMQHWTYYKLRKLISVHPNSINKESIYDKLKKIMDNINKEVLKRHPCKYYFDGEFSEWKIEKDFHDYFRNYDSIKNCNPEKHDCEKLLEYVTHITNLYREKEEDCCFYGMLDQDYCRPYFKCEPDYNPHELLSILKDKIQESNKVKDTETKAENSVKDNINVVPHSDGSLSDEANDETLPTTSRDILFEDTTSYSALEKLYDMFNLNYFRPSIVVASLLGTSLFLFFYYKSTSLGSSVNKKELKKDIFNYNYDEYHDKLSEYEVDSQFLGHKNERIYLSYSGT